MAEAEPIADTKGWDVTRGLLMKKMNGAHLSVLKTPKGFHAEIIHGNLPDDVTDDNNDFKASHIFKKRGSAMRFLTRIAGMI